MPNKAIGTGAHGYENMNRHMGAQVACNVLVALLTLALFMIVKKIETPTFYSSFTIDQMVDEWQQEPWTSMVAGDRLGNCPATYEPMFTNLWQGTVDGVIITYETGP
jgi:hypothetical protein